MCSYLDRRNAKGEQTEPQGFRLEGDTKERKERRRRGLGTSGEGEPEARVVEHPADRVWGRERPELLSPSFGEMIENKAGLGFEEEEESASNFFFPFFCF